MDFNPRPREEGDCKYCKNDRYSSNFNPRPREEGDIVSAVASQGQYDFNPRPREEGDICFVYPVLFCIYFNPRPREEGDQQYVRRRITPYYISIHALVKRATWWFYKQRNSTFYFNPRPREEGDMRVTATTALTILFQSTPSWRGRLAVEKTFRNPSYISIHALVKRATQGQYGTGEIVGDFNPRPREEGDLLMTITAVYLIWYFNPRPREEGDSIRISENVYQIIISIHALVKRATL